MLQLNKLEKLHKKRKRIGRGGDSGGTSGKGHKGQCARSGSKIHPGFEGGQMPLSRRLPKRGFSNKRFQTEVKIINLNTLENVFDSGQHVDVSVLREKKLIKGRKKFLLKILGTGVLSKNLTVCADMFSAKAKDAIEKAGGKAQVVEG
jgi:large subunit ribosomal protein L15